jgi:hypothetical protein
MYSLPSEIVYLIYSKIILKDTKDILNFCIVDKTFRDFYKTKVNTNLGLNLQYYINKSKNYMHCCELCNKYIPNNGLIKITQTNMPKILFESIPLCKNKKYINCLGKYRCNINCSNRIFITKKNKCIELDPIHFYYGRVKDKRNKYSNIHNWTFYYQYILKYRIYNIHLYFTLKKHLLFIYLFYNNEYCCILDFLNKIEVYNSLDTK